MEWLEGLGLFGLFIGTFLAATVFPFSSDVWPLSVIRRWMTSLNWNMHAGAYMLN